jgi:undecaprenyl-diphosphatase
MRDGQADARDDERKLFALAGLSVLFLCAFLWLGLLVRGGPTSIDLTVVDLFERHLSAAFRAVLDGLTTLGQPVLWDTGVLAVAVVLWVRRHWRASVELLVSVLTVETAATAAKILFDRTRPGGVGVSDFITQASYPSGHVVRTVVAVVLLATFMPTRRSRVIALTTAVALVLLMGAARIVSGEHWPTDVVGGYLLAASVLCAVGAVRRARDAALRRSSDGTARNGPR